MAPELVMLVPALMVVVVCACKYDVQKKQQSINKYLLMISLLLLNFLIVAYAYFIRFKHWGKVLQLKNSFLFRQPIISSFGLNNIDLI